MRSKMNVLGTHFADALEKRGFRRSRMSQLKRIIVGYDLAAGGETALKSAVVLADRCRAALRLVHVIEPLDSYQRISHPLTAPYTLEEIAQRTGVKLEALVASPELARLQVEYEVRKGKPFVELIIAGRAWLADLIVVGGTSLHGGALSRQHKRADPAQGPGTRHGGAEAPECRSQNLFSTHGFLLLRQKSR